MYIHTEKIYLQRESFQLLTPLDFRARSSNLKLVPLGSIEFDILRFFQNN